MREALEALSNRWTRRIYDQYGHCGLAQADTAYSRSVRVEDEVPLVVDAPPLAHWEPSQILRATPLFTLPNFLVAPLGNGADAHMQSALTISEQVEADAATACEDTVRVLRLGDEVLAIDRLGRMARGLFDTRSAAHPAQTKIEVYPQFLRAHICGRPLRCILTDLDNARLLICTVIVNAPTSPYTHVLVYPRAGAPTLGLALVGFADAAFTFADLLLQLRAVLGYTPSEVTSCHHSTFRGEMPPQEAREVKVSDPVELGASSVNHVIVFHTAHLPFIASRVTICYRDSGGRRVGPEHLFVRAHHHQSWCSFRDRLPRNCQPPLRVRFWYSPPDAADAPLSACREIDPASEATLQDLGLCQGAAGNDGAEPDSNRLPLDGSLVKGRANSRSAPPVAAGCLHVQLLCLPSFALLPLRATPTVNPGDVVYATFQDGDRALLNRQPTLNKGSFGAVRMRIGSPRTLGMSVQATKPFAADFDGDAATLYGLCSETTQAEAVMLSFADGSQLIQNGATIVGTVQDSTVAPVQVTGKERYPPRYAAEDVQLRAHDFETELALPSELSSELQLSCVVRLTDDEFAGQMDLCIETDTSGHRRTATTEQVRLTEWSSSTYKASLFLNLNELQDMDSVCVKLHIRIVRPLIMYDPPHSGAAATTEPCVVFFDRETKQPIPVLKVVECGSVLVSPRSGTREERRWPIISVLERKGTVFRASTEPRGSGHAPLDQEVEVMFDDGTTYEMELCFVSLLVETTLDCAHVDLDDVAKHGEPPLPTIAFEGGRVELTAALGGEEAELRRRVTKGGLEHEAALNFLLQKDVHVGVDAVHSTRAVSFLRRTILTCSASPTVSPPLRGVCQVISADGSGVVDVVFIGEEEDGPAPLTLRLIIEYPSPEALPVVTATTLLPCGDANAHSMQLRALPAHVRVPVHVARWKRATHDPSTLTFQDDQSFHKIPPEVLLSAALAVLNRDDSLRRDRMACAFNLAMELLPDSNDENVLFSTRELIARARHAALNDRMGGHDLLSLSIPRDVNYVHRRCGVVIRDGQVAPHGTFGNDVTGDGKASSLLSVVAMGEEPQAPRRAARLLDAFANFSNVMMMDGWLSCGVGDSRAPSTLLEAVATWMLYRSDPDASTTALPAGPCYGPYVAGGATTDDREGMRAFFDYALQAIASLNARCILRDANLSATPLDAPRLLKQSGMDVTSDVINVLLKLMKKALLRVEYRGDDEAQAQACLNLLRTKVHPGDDEDLFAARTGNGASVVAWVSAKLPRMGSMHDALIGQQELRVSVERFDLWYAENNLATMIFRAGSKGGSKNAAHMLATVGQQSGGVDMEGRTFTLRSMPHVPLGADTLFESFAGDAPPDAPPPPESAEKRRWMQATEAANPNPNTEAAHDTEEPQAATEAAQDTVQAATEELGAASKAYLTARRRSETKWSSAHNCWVDVDHPRATQHGFFTDGLFDGMTPMGFFVAEGQGRDGIIQKVRRSGTPRPSHPADAPSLYRRSRSTPPPAVPSPSASGTPCDPSSRTSASWSHAAPTGSRS